MENQLFNSTLNFLQAYARNYEQRQQRISDIEKRFTDLRPAVEEAAALETEKESLKKLNKDEEKFLVAMNTIFLQSTGQPITNGPLWDESNKEVEYE